MNTSLTHCQQKLNGICFTKVSKIWKPVLVITLKFKASCLCNTKTALYFRLWNSLVKVHVWTQILYLVSKNRDNFSLEEAGFLLFPRKIIHVRALSETAVWPELKQEVYEKLGGFFILKSSYVEIAVCIWGVFVVSVFLRSWPQICSSSLCLTANLSDKTCLCFRN